MMVFIGGLPAKTIPYRKQFNYVPIFPFLLLFIRVIDNKFQEKLLIFM